MGKCVCLFPIHGQTLLYTGVKFNMHFGNFFFFYLTKKKKSMFELLLLSGFKHLVLLENMQLPWPPRRHFLSLEEKIKETVLQVK